MGIDKADVRAVYHITYSNSLESFVQEAGRAGRDKKISESVVLYNNSSIFRINLNLFTKENYSANNFLQNISHRKAIRWDLLFPLDAITNQKKPLLSNTRAALENVIDTITFRFHRQHKSLNKLKSSSKEILLKTNPIEQYMIISILTVSKELTLRNPKSMTYLRIRNFLYTEIKLHFMTTLKIPMMNIFPSQ